MPLKLVRCRKGGEVWYVRGSVRGRRIEESTGTSDRRKAEEVRTRRENELLDEALYGRSVRATFAAAVVGYLEAGGSRRFLKPLLDRFDRTPVRDIGQDAIDLAASALYPRASAATRVRQIYTPMSAVLAFAATRGWCDRIKIARPKVKKKPYRWLRVAEAERLVACASPHLRPLLVFLLYTGARLSEALSLDWHDVDLTAGRVAFLDTKGGNDRGVALHPLALAALANLPHRRGHVFLTDRGEPYAAKTDEGGQIKRAFATARTRAGLGPDVTPHVLRHTWATWWLAQNGNLVRLKEIGGWADIQSVMVYAHVDVAGAAPTMHALPAISLGENRGSEAAQAEPEKRKSS